MKKILLTFIFILYPISGFPSHEAMVVSISSDGAYAISSHMGKKLILWDITNKKAKIIAKNVNIYSAYFIKKTHLFMWQDLNNKVIIQNVDGKIIQSFLFLPTYGQAITSDLKHYFASDIHWNLFIKNGNSTRIIKKAFDIYNFASAQKLLNLTLSDDNKFLLSAGLAIDDYDKLPIKAGWNSFEAEHVKPGTIGINASLFDGIVLWDTKTGAPIKKFFGNVFKTSAAISPKGDYIVGIDENYWGFVWRLPSGKREFVLWDLSSGNPIKYNQFNVVVKFDATGLIPPPDDFMLRKKSAPCAIYAVRFIDNDYYLRFDTDVPYAILYRINDPKPLKYFFLGDSPTPSLDDYTRNQAIDTSPSTNTLVMAKESSGGIIVYKYHPQSKILEKIWSPAIPLF